MRRWNQESREAKAAQICKVEYRTGESCPEMEKLQGSSVDKYIKTIVTILRMFKKQERRLIMLGYGKDFVNL